MTDQPLPQRRLKMTAERKAAFLEHLREHGLLGYAAKHASPGRPLGALQSFRDERQRDPEFSQAWDDAMEDADEELMRQIKARGIDGIEEDVYGSQGPGQGTGVVGTKKVYSDKMAELYARVMSVRVRQGLANRVELEANVKHQGLELGKLSPKQQALLEELLRSDEAES